MTTPSNKTIQMTTLKFSALAVIVFLSACASNTQSRVNSAATTPLGDLNIIREAIPPVLEAAQKQPYLIPADQSCAAIALDIHKLDNVLGPDLDTPSTESNPSLINLGVEAAGDSTIGAIQRTTEGLIPFRSWVRKLTGAERHANQVSASITAGSIRRAFLKGISASNKCIPTAPTAAPSTAAAPAQ